MSWRWVLLFLFLPGVLLAQEKPLTKGQSDVLWGVRTRSTTTLFDHNGDDLRLDEALSLTETELRTFSLEGRFSYAITERLLFSVEGPLVRSLTLTGTTLIGQEAFARTESAVGPGDLTTSLSFLPRPNEERPWGVSVLLRLPTGDETTRLPLGTGIPSFHMGAFGRMNHNRLFVYGALYMGNGNSLTPEVLPSLGLGGGKRFTLSQELRGQIPLGRDEVGPTARQTLSGVAPQKGLFLSALTLCANLGEVRPTLSLQVPLLGQDQPKGPELFFGIRVVRPGYGDPSKPSALY